MTRITSTHQAPTVDIAMESSSTTPISGRKFSVGCSEALALTTALSLISTANAHLSDDSSSDEGLSTTEIALVASVCGLALLCVVACGVYIDYIRRTYSDIP